MSKQDLVHLEATDSRSAEKVTPASENDLVPSSIPVLFMGEHFVWLREVDGSGALAYPQHIDQDGDVKLMFVTSESYAHVMSDGSILRYGSVIGTRDDLALIECATGDA